MLAVLLAIGGVPLAAQARHRLATTARFYADPRGTELGALNRGATVTLGKVSGGWREATFEAWIFSTSTGPANRPGFNLAVSSPAGENLRSSPNGTVIGRAVQGTQLNLLERRGGWVRVRRTAWLAPDAVPAARPAGNAPAGAPPPPPAVRIVAAQDTLERVVVRKGATLSLGPGEAPLGNAPAELQARVTARSGNWVQVRTETWVRDEDVRPMADTAGVSLEQLLADPDRYIGDLVLWRLQFLSVQTADELRPELPTGQPYVLARGPLPAAGFVYVLVSREQADRFRAMNPLEEFVANGIVRAARTRYLPTPVIELQGAR